MSARKRAPRHYCPNCKQLDPCAECTARRNAKQRERKRAERVAGECHQCHAPTGGGPYCETHRVQRNATQVRARRIKRARAARALESFQRTVQS